MRPQAGNNVVESSTANRTRRSPSVFAGGFGSEVVAGGMWNFVSSSDVFVDLG